MELSEINLFESENKRKFAPTETYTRGKMWRKGEKSDRKTENAASQEMA